MASFGDLLKNLTQSLGGAAESSVLGVDIGASSAKVVQLRPAHGAAILETYGEIALGPYAGQPIGKAVRLPPDKIAVALTDLMKEANVTSRAGGLSIPFASSLITVLDLPKVDKSTLKQVIPIEARKYIPVPISEVSLDWFVLPEEKSETTSAFDTIRPQQPSLSAMPGVSMPPSVPAGQKPKGQEVLLVAIHNDVMTNFQTIATDAGIKVEFYEIEIFSAIRSCFSHGMAPVLFVDIGAATTKMYVVERGIVRLTHLLTFGGQQMTEVLGRAMNWEFEKAERVKRERGLEAARAYSDEENKKISEALLSTLSRLFSEVNRVLLSYGQRYNKNVSHVVLAGGSASLPGLAQEAKGALNAEVEIADPFARTEAPAFLADVLRDIGPGFAVSAGVALRKLKG